MISEQPYISDSGSEFTGINIGLHKLLKDRYPKILTSTCDSHAIHNSFGDAMKFLISPKSMKKFIISILI